MTVQILFAAKEERWAQYEAPLRRALEGAGITDYVLSRDIAPEAVDYMVVAPNGPVQDFAPYRNCKAALNLWAGVENIIGNPTLHMPLARMVDHGLTRGMVEWVTGHVLRHHLGMDAHIHGQDGKWRKDIPPLAEERRVSILGLGELGAECADALRYLGFDVTGWSRSQKDLPGIRCLAGEEGLAEALGTAEILVLLLPKTADTENVLNAERIAQMPRGAVIINPGRGPLIDDDALLAALDEGRIAHATLDVFRTEPLPPEHPYWAHPSVTVTPHIASETRDETASRVIAENIRRGEAGEPFLHLVDPKLGY
ncbi:glyoxylate/hydroxypyruvate reductase A [Roseovarius nanhaiticus]|uniref:Glyoxylate/hydroxypyruvate reductase A n=1 Tax=Roseovarius nanhaiticus TaxID=573024 RepID=A0A1N7FEV0_9RHOB|nr:glyoxylate/hydroxypyruvate reductase A [Roseovarius nanhaiticus]SEK56147.1 glyoxylate/hydroxypyruvate reductase A [Roseovarius nanhaiticus]SIR98837.1 glyoxylate/hydroxypyruvate reductase A [Roseovarius nanhaiticus]